MYRTLSPVRPPEPLKKTTVPQPQCPTCIFGTSARRPIHSSCGVPGPLSAFGASRASTVHTGDKTTRLALKA
eukprot:3720704-Pleurochrysis_carterae.AAC.1